MENGENKEMEEALFFGGETERREEGRSRGTPFGEDPKKKQKERKEKQRKRGGTPFGELREKKREKSSKNQREVKQRLPSGSPFRDPWEELLREK